MFKHNNVNQIMKKSLLFFALICLAYGYSTAQTYLIHVKPMDSKIWKYADIKGDIVINCEYPVSYEFSEDGFGVGYYPKKNQYLLINSKGEEISTEITGFLLKDIFGYAGKGFSDGLVVVKITNKWGCLNTAGKVAIPLKYDNLSEFNNGFAIAKINERFYIVDHSGNEISVDDPNIKDIKEFSENLAPYTLLTGEKGFINTKGEKTIPAKFLSVGYFKNGLAWAKTKEELFGYLDKNGEWIIQPQFTAAKDFDGVSGLARVKKNEKWVYVNVKNEIVAFEISETTDDFSDGLAKGKKALLFGFYNNKGEWVIPPKFENVRDFKNGFAAAKLNDKWGIIDGKGNWVIEPKFSGIKDVISVKQ